MSERKRTIGAVTIRQLARETTAILDRVRAADAPVIVTRRGVPIATIHPLDVNPWAGREIPRRDGLDALGLRDKPVDLEELGLSTLERTFLQQRPPLIPDRLTSETGCSLAEASKALVRLEIDGFIRREFYGYHLTALGRRAAEAINATQAVEVDDRDRDGKRSG